MASDVCLLPADTLWPRTLAATKHGLACGALQSIATESELVEDEGIPFVVRIAANVVRKEQAAVERRASKGKDFNPFLPYDKDLFVADLSTTHVCILNKFNVVDHHLLMVTRAFEEQESLLTAQDFEAMWLALRDIDGLAFYNGGKLAGASQKHKHLQLVPLPMVEQGPALPMEAAFSPRDLRAGLNRVPTLPFAHGLMHLNPAWAYSPTEAGAKTLKLYHQLLLSLGLEPEGNYLKAGAYNLLATRDWMLMVPRRAEGSQGISINSLGFAGSLFVKDEAQLEKLKAIGPMSILKAVAQAGGRS